MVPRYLHAAHQHAESRYAQAATEALGDRAGVGLTADPAWGAVVRRLHDAEHDGHDPARLLSAVTGRRELASAAAVAEVLAWRIDTYLKDNPEPPAAGQPYESATAARDRLTQFAAATLGPATGKRAQAETAWPALITALRRAENQGHDPAGILTSAAATRELRTARSISEVLAWRINRHLATGTVPVPARTASPPTQPAATDLEGTPAAQPPAHHGLLPWVPGPPRQMSANSGIPASARYLNEAADLITARMEHLAGTAIRHRAPWMHPLGQPPANPEAERQWRHHVAVIAAYRDQHKITTSDPRQILGPYPARGHAGHKAYWHAAESVLTARQLTGLDPASTAGPDAQARAQLAIDIYKALPASERAAITKEMAAAQGAQWFGDRTAPDEDAAAQPVHAATLASALVRHGHMTTAVAEPATRQAVIREPLEAELARHGLAHKPLSARNTAPKAAARPLMQPPTRSLAPTTTAPQPRL